MNARLHFCILALFACAGAQTIRHNVEVPMPGRLSVRRNGTSLSVSFDAASLRKVKIAAGEKMTLGLKHELRVYEKGEARPLAAAGVGYASIKEPVTPANFSYLKSTQIIPAPGKRCIVEEDLSLFETDVPPQHMWNPQAGKTYTVLWKETLKSVK